MKAIKISLVLFVFVGAPLLYFSLINVGSKPKIGNANESFKSKASTIQTINEDKPKIYIKGNKILGGDGKQIRLKGISSSLFRFHDSSNSVEELESRVLEFKDLGVNLVVLYLDQPAELENKIDKIIDFSNWAKSEKLFVLLNPVVNGSENQVFNFAVNPNQKLFSPIDSRLETVMDSLADKLSDNEYVLYGTGSEPHNVTENSWQSEQNKLINIIRKHSPKSVVVVSALNWGRSLDYYIKNPVPGDNILYDLHYYVSSTKENMVLANCRLFLDGMGDLPVFIGEFGGTVYADFGSKEDLDCTQKLLTNFDELNLSYSIYTVDAVESEKFSGLSIMTQSNELTPKGQLFANNLKEK